MDQYTDVLEKLKNGEMESFEVSKEDFLAFRTELLKHEDFKHFRGEAKQGGDIIYTYLEEARS